MPLEDQDAALETCSACGELTPLGEIAFPEPDDETNTQYGWLVGVCPNCEAKIQVPYDRIRVLLANKPAR